MRTNILLLSLLSLIGSNIFAANTKTVTLKMSEPSTGLSNTTQIYFAPGTSANYVSPEDSKENFDTLQPLIYSLTADGIACNSNGYGNLNSSVVIPIGYQVEQAGTFIFSVSTGIGLDAGSVIILEDKTLGTFTNLLQSNDTVQITQPGQYQTRFYLHVSAAPVITTVASGCDNTDGVIYVAQDTAITWTSVLLFDSNKVVIQQLHYINGDINFNSLPGGGYFVAFYTSSGYLFVDQAEVTGHAVQLAISSSVKDVEIGQDIQFYSVVSSASNYAWSFGDSTIITGIANPTYDFIESGSYSVELHVTNDFQCTADAYITILVSAQQATSVMNTPDKDINVYSYNKSVVIANNSLTVSNITYEIYNLAGQLLITAPVTSSNFIIGMDNQSAGIYIVQVKTENGSFTRKLLIG